MVTLSEENRRMQDMMKMYGMTGMMGMGPDMFADRMTLILNANNPLVTYILNNKEADNIDMFCKHLYDLALISHEPLKPEAMTEFIKRSNDILLALTEK